MADGNGRNLTSTVLGVIGAAAGLVVVLSLIGALISWERFRTLDLPNQAASATLSQSTLLVVGVRAMFAPLLLGLVAVGLSILLESLGWRLRGTRLWVAGLCVLILTVLAALIGPWYLPLYIALAGLLLFGGREAMRAEVPGWIVAYMMVFVMVGAGIFAAIWQIMQPPTNLERAEVVFSNGTAPVYGFWIADTSTTVYVAPQVGGRDGPCQVTGQVVAFPREDVATIRFDSVVSVWSIHSESTPDPCED